MTKTDREHFEEYREQTRIKHVILSKYLAPYFQIRAVGDHKNLVYIDAFAGAGQYQSPQGLQPGSPLHALNVFAKLKPEIGQKISTIFIEIDEELFNRLEVCVAACHKQLPTLREPSLHHSSFEDGIDALLNALKEGKSKLAPSFLFADPCGVSGLGFSTLVRYLKEAEGEAFLFFNYEGVNRIAGLGYKPGGTLSQLVGSDNRASDLITLLAGKEPKEREEIIVSFYQRALKIEVPDVFCTAFRVESDHKQATSHYLMHLTRNGLGFRLMKEVMWPLGESADGRGGLALEQASVKQGARLFRPDWEKVKASILDEIGKKGQVQTKFFYETLSQQPDNRLCQPAYRKALLELEATGKIRVLDVNGNPTTANTRMKRKGEPTLSEKYLVVLA